MTLNTFTSGINTSFSSELNQNFGVNLSVTGKNTIRQLQDRSVSFSADITDGWGESFIDSNGRNNSIVNADTTARWDSASLVFFPAVNDVSSGDTTSDPDSFTNAANAFDGDVASYAQKSVTNDGDFDYTLGKTFSAKTIKRCYVSVTYSTAQHDGSYNADLIVESYNGSSWSAVETLYSQNGISSNLSLSYNRMINVNSSVQGLRVRFIMVGGGATADATLRVYLLEYETAYPSVRSTVAMTIPTGSFNTAISSSFSTVIAGAYESGATIDYKIKNSSGDDSGWLTLNEINNFTTFSHGEPDEFIIGITPKSSSPTTNTPSLKGAWVIAR